MKRILYFVCCSALLILSSCKVDFSPNASWKEVPVVYCIIDQDDPITYVRVQKCYLGEDNLYNYSTIYDSVNYPVGSLKVEIRAWRVGDTAYRSQRNPVSVLSFRDTVLAKVDGQFSFDQGQPLFYHRNRTGDINPKYAYELVVTKVATGEVLASAMTMPIGQFDKTKWLLEPSRSIGHSFKFSRDYRSEVKWCTDSLHRGRLYQPTVRFYYTYRYDRPDSLRYIDYRASRVKCTDPNVNSLSTFVQRDSYLSLISETLANDTNRKHYVNFIDVMLNVCNEDLYAYISSTDPTSSLNQDHKIYTNIHGGIGVFASRRTHVVMRAPADSSDAAPNGMHYLLQQCVPNID